MIGILLGSAGFWSRIFFRDSRGSSYSPEVDFLFLGLWWFSVATFSLMMGAMVYFVWKYRWRPGQPLIRSSSHNTVLELAWTIIPTILVVPIFIAGFVVYSHQIVAPAGTLNIDLEAKKWTWDLTFPNGAGATQSTKPNEMGALEIPIYILPEDTAVKLTMSSDDVIHSFWVPDFRFKQDVFPNRFNTYWFQTNKLRDTDRDNPDLPYPNSDHWVFCAEYCGDNHSEMAAILRVVPKAEFAKWLNEPFAKGQSLVEIGQTLHKTKGCVQCHTTDGSRGTGPTWKNLFGYESHYNSAPAWVIDENAIREAIYEPQAKIRQGFPNQMASYQGRINGKELRAIIAYMKSLSDKSTDLDPTLTWGDVGKDGSVVPQDTSPGDGTDDGADAGSGDAGSGDAGSGDQESGGIGGQG